MQQERKRRWMPVLIVVTLFAATMLLISTGMVASWSDLSSSSRAEATLAFDKVLSELAGPAFIQITADGSVKVRSELKSEQSHDLGALLLLVWSPDDGRLLRTRIPYWFARAKMNDTLDLGTLIAFLVRDWENLRLNIGEEDLEARGPGLLLDHTSVNGRRVLLWSE